MTAVLTTEKIADPNLGIQGEAAVSTECATKQEAIDAGLAWFKASYPEEAWGPEGSLPGLYEEIGYLPRSLDMLGTFMSGRNNEQIRVAVDQ